MAWLGLLQVFSTLDDGLPTFDRIKKSTNKFLAPKAANSYGIETERP